MLALFKRYAASTLVGNHRVFSLLNRCHSSSRVAINEDEWNSYGSGLAGDGTGSRICTGGISSLPLISQDRPRLDSRELEVVDLDTWSISSGLASVSRSKQKELQLGMVGLEEVEVGFVGDTEIDEIEDMRNDGRLFYKIERSSMEFEEYQFDFHGKKPKYYMNDEREVEKEVSLKCGLAQNGQNSLKGKVGQQGISKKSNVNDCSMVNKEHLAKTIREKYVVCSDDLDVSSARKKLRNTTFNQLTGPFHEPFCLDIYVSKGSVRACVVHRVTSKVVVVAHSISKDIKFGLGSPKSRVAAFTVGTTLAQRALADDIHDVIYTPRKGDKLEGKLQVVLQAIIDNGVNVKVKLKLRNPSKAFRRPPADEE